MMTLIHNQDSPPIGNVIFNAMAKQALLLPLAPCGFIRLSLEFEEEWRYWIEILKNRAASERASVEPGSTLAGMWD